MESGKNILKGKLPLFLDCEELLIIIDEVVVMTEDSPETKITWVAWNKTLASKKYGSLWVSSFHALNRALLLKWIRDGYERQQWLDLLSTLGSITPSSAAHRWVCDLNGDGEFHVKDIRSSLDDLFLLSMTDAIRWVKYIPVKVNVFVWRARLVRLPTRGNLVSRGVFLDSTLYPVCGLALEDVQHVFFRCDVAKLIFNRICRWWDLH
nr:RNA-directed DNA polymerase, eukaryota [Tanacetum cinerariifolium]